MVPTINYFLIFEKRDEMILELTPKDRHQRVGHHFHDPHRPVSNLYFEDPQAGLLFQTYGQDRAAALRILCSD